MDMAYRQELRNIEKRAISLPPFRRNCNNDRGVLLGKDLHYVDVTNISYICF